MLAAATTSTSAALPHAVPFRATNRPSIHASTLEFGVYQESLWTLLFTGAASGVKKIGPTVIGSATSMQWAIAPNTEHSYYSRMLVRNLIRVCGEELLKAKRAIVFAYGAIREADERTMDLLMMFLGIR
jgi:hypothetical protein